MKYYGDDNSYGYMMQFIDGCIESASQTADRLFAAWSSTNDIYTYDLFTYWKNVAAGLRWAKAQAEQSTRVEPNGNTDRVIDDRTGPRGRWPN